MNTFQTLISLVVLVFVLSVVVQAIQEVIKGILDTKASVMKQTVEKFMGQRLTLEQVTHALAGRGLNVAALENFDRQDFRHLLDAIQFQNAQLGGVVTSAQATVEQIKDNIAASYEAARAAFQKEYSTKNKLFALLISFIVVILLNANLIYLYKQVSVDFAVQQAIVGQASKIQTVQSGKGSLEEVYSQSRDQIGKALDDYPILIRTSKYPDDFAHPFYGIVGLLWTGILVSLGAPFWNDVLKGMMGINNVLNTGSKKAS